MPCLSPILRCAAITVLVATSLPLMASSRQAVLDTARKYLVHGLVEQRPDLVPVAVSAWRTEQGRDTGSTGAEIKRRLSGSEYRLIAGISNERWVVEGDEAVVFYNLHLQNLPLPVLIAERFKVVDGEITEIEALYRKQPAELGERLAGDAITAAFADTVDTALVQDNAGTRALNYWFADGRLVNEWANAHGAGRVTGQWRVRGGQRCVVIESGLPEELLKGQATERCSPVYRQGEYYLSVNADGSVHGIHSPRPMKSMKPITTRE